MMRDSAASEIFLTLYFLVNTDSEPHLAESCWLLCKAAGNTSSQAEIIQIS